MRELNLITGNRLFGGESDREAASKKLYQSTQSFGNELRGINSAVTNRFNNYQDPFGYSKMKESLDESYDSGKADINNIANIIGQNSQNQTASRLASQGITGGSTFNEMIGGAKSDANRQRFNALTTLKGQIAGKNIGLMESANDRGFRNTQAAQNVDLQNVLNNLQKYGLIQGNFGVQGQAIQGLDDGTWLDDALGILNVGGSLINPIASLFSSPKKG